ncbi:MAG: MerR family transcriptional regulator [Cyanomargarita calcarea GSE-NOS-MK-12-04C]|jgi:MerR family Zn(II)-responsive transcriptional regulator of zntA|uniref:MerR family transcriptional regulator n=1 Tax=Cyanomargarita calcarea GSE-NOS-MK-12-04C TaxID=2839659 RepID=A0A951QVG4_9CYAN|nr:MerR family transcriptional regulator [Cyanomargarita calcarea GSE-NOS-MK-12-04C]
MLISELSQKTGVSKDTLRFYEKTGLLNSNNKRGENNYRNYDDEAVSRLEFIKHGKSLGFTLSEIKKAMDEWDILSPEDKAQLTRTKIAEMDEKIVQLQEFRCHLALKLKRLESER